MRIGVKNNPSSFARLIPGLTFPIDSPTSPHHEMDKENPLIAKMESKLLAMGLNLINSDLFEGGLKVFELPETEFDSDLPPLEYLLQLFSIMMN
jgi:hypothetical protein